jgi:hypothetical protein
MSIEIRGIKMKDETVCGVTACGRPAQRCAYGAIDEDGVWALYVCDVGHNTRLVAALSPSGYQLSVTNARALCWEGGGFVIDLLNSDQPDANLSDDTERDDAH